MPARDARFADTDPLALRLEIDRGALEALIEHPVLLQPEDGRSGWAGAARRGVHALHRAQPLRVDDFVPEERPDVEAIVTDAIDDMMPGLGALPDIALNVVDALGRHGMLRPDSRPPLEEGPHAKAAAIAATCDRAVAMAAACDHEPRCRSYAEHAFKSPSMSTLLPEPDVEPPWSLLWDGLTVLGVGLGAFVLGVLVGLVL